MFVLALAAPAVALSASVASLNGVEGLKLNMSDAQRRAAAAAAAEERRVLHVWAGVPGDAGNILEEQAQARRAKRVAELHKAAVRGDANEWENDLAGASG